MTNLNCLRTTLAATLLFALSPSGCAGDRGSSGPGGAEVKVYALDAGDVATVTVTVTGPGIAVPIVVNMTKVGDQWVANLSEIPAGVDRTFTLSARDAEGVEIYSGVATGVTITAGQTAAVSINGQENNPAPPVGNRSPVIDALTASTARIAQGGSIALSVAAHDGDTGDLITFLWTAAGGTLDTPAQASTNWTAPAVDGAYRVTVRVQDTHGASTSMYVDLTVAADASSEATITVTLNQWPVVTGVTSTQGRIDVNESTTLDVVATDADGDTLTYAWTADEGCIGAFDQTNIKSPTFTLGAALPAAGTCQFIVTVSDGRGGTNTGSITVTAAPAPPVNLAPRITMAAQSVEKNVAAGQTVNMAVQAEDPEATALTFTWTATGGTLGTPTTTSGSSQVVWTAPTPFGVEAFVSCTVADATGLTTVKMFTITAIDTSAPTVTALSFSPNAIDTTNSAASVTVTATLADNLSGFDVAGFLFHSPSGTWTESCWVRRSAGTSQLRTYSSTCTVEFPRYSAAGTWTLAEVYLADEASNKITLAAANLTAKDFPVNLTVTSNADIATPVLTSLAITPSVDTSAASATVTMTATVTDDLSGVWQLDVMFASPSGTQEQECVIYAPDGMTPLSLTGSCSVEIPRYSEAGKWQVEWLFISDFAGNYIVPEAAGLVDMGFEPYFTVTSGS
jgi:hypothetical protein